MPDHGKDAVAPEAEKRGGSSAAAEGALVTAAPEGVDAAGPVGSGVDVHVVATLRPGATTAGAPEWSVVLQSSGSGFSLEVRMTEPGGSSISVSAGDGVALTPGKSPADPAPLPTAPSDTPAAPPPAGPATPAGPVTPDAPESEMHHGYATTVSFTKGSCGFPAATDSDMVGAMNTADYADASACGRFVRINGPEGSIDLQIIDECPGCTEGSLDLGPAAFSRIAPLLAGRVPITWQFIPAPVSGPIVYHFSQASNPYWTSVQIRNHRHGIASADMKHDGAWVAMTRGGDNYFTHESSPDDAPLSFRVTDVLGNVLEDSDIRMIADGDSTGAQQFPKSRG